MLFQSLQSPQLTKSNSQKLSKKQHLNSLMAEKQEIFKWTRCTKENIFFKSV